MRSLFTTILLSLSVIGFSQITPEPYCIFDPDNAIKYDQEQNLKLQEFTRQFKTEKGNPLLSLIAVNGNYTDETVLAFIEGSEVGFDPYDTQKMFATNDNYPQIWYEADGISLAVNILPVLQESMSFPLGFRAMIAGDYSIETFRYENFNAGTKIILEDLLANTSITLTDTSVYTFSSEVVDNNDRFVIHLYSAVIDSVPLKLHIIRKTDTTGQNATIEEIVNELNITNSYFVNANMRFYILPDINYIDEDSLYEYDHASDFEAILTDNYCPFAVNMYFMNSISWTDYSVCGIGSSIGYEHEYLLMNYNCIGDGNVLTHELGHVFHLAHTHGKYNFETEECAGENWDDEYITDELWCEGAAIYDNNETLDINSDGIGDCLQTGDNVCDTHAEPNLSWDNMMDGCEYIGTATDPNGDIYNPVIGNIMSYGPCDDHMTIGQYARIRFAYENYGLHLLSGSCEPVSERIVTNKNNTGEGSLRWAIANANRQEQEITINFDITSASPHLIELESRLPNLHKNILINGNSQSKAEIVIDGSKITDESGLAFCFLGDSIEISGLTIQNFPGTAIHSYYAYDNLKINDVKILSNNGEGINIHSCNNLQIVNNEIADNENIGIYLFDCSQAEILGNKISGNGGSGIYLNECNTMLIGDSTAIGKNLIYDNAFNGLSLVNETHDIEIINNHFGTDENESPDLGNIYNGIVVNNGYNIKIGKLNAGNLFTSNGYEGIVLLGDANNIEVIANRIINNHSNGIYIDSSAYINLGGKNSGQHNIISGNGYSGLFLNNYSHDINILNNYIGTNENGLLGIGNIYNGIIIKSSHDINIGNSQGGNIITQSGYSGLVIMDATSNIGVFNNDIVSNGSNGIQIDSSWNMTIGDSESGGNLISNNGYSGIFVFNNAFDLNIYNNIIGADITGTSNFGNTYNGIAVKNSSNINIGKSNQGNLISGNSHNGILVYEKANNVSIIGNKIGTDISGSLDLNNVYAGLSIDSSENVIVGGETDEEENVIAYNATSIRISDHAENYLIKRNRLFCSDWAVYFSNIVDEIDSPYNLEVQDAYTISGFAPSESLIMVYKSDTNCVSCEGKIYLGQAIAIDNEWELSLTGVLINGESITAMTIIDSTSSAFAECIKVEGLPDNIEGIRKISKIEFYPNPATDVINFKTSSNNLSISVYNLFGVEVLHFDEVRNSINISELPVGIYTVKMEIESHVYIDRFVKR